MFYFKIIIILVEFKSRDDKASCSKPLLRTTEGGQPGAWLWMETQTHWLPFFVPSENPLMFLCPFSRENRWVIMCSLELRGVLRSMNAGTPVPPISACRVSIQAHARDHFTSGGGGVTDHTWEVRLSCRKSMGKRWKATEIVGCNDWLPKAFPGMRA